MSGVGNASKFHVWYNTSTSCHVFSNILWFQLLFNVYPNIGKMFNLTPAFNISQQSLNHQFGFSETCGNWRRAPWIFHSQGCVIYAVLCQMNRSDVSMSNSVSPNVSRLGRWGPVGSHWKGLEVEGYWIRNGKRLILNMFFLLMSGVHRRLCGSFYLSCPEKKRSGAVPWDQGCSTIVFGTSRGTREGSFLHGFRRP